MPDVLDFVHRRTIAKAMARVGIKLQDTSWKDLDKYNSEFYKRYPEASPLIVEYDGSHSFGPILGKPHYLVTSQPTGYIVEKAPNLDLVRRQMEIRIQEAGGPPLWEASRILLLPDSPPVAVHGQDYDYVRKQHSPRSYPSDSVILRDITQRFGQEAIDFISEGAAKSVANALLHDDAEIAEI